VEASAASWDAVVASRRNVLRGIVRGGIDLRRKATANLPFFPISSPASNAHGQRDSHFVGGQVATSAMRLFTLRGVLFALHDSCCLGRRK